MKKNIFFPTVQQPLVGLDLLIIEASRSHSDTLHWVGILWTSDPPVTETFDNTQHSQVKDVHAPGGIRSSNPIKRAAADQDHRKRGL